MTQLLPADIDQIIEDFGYLFQAYPKLTDTVSIFSDYIRTQKRLEVLFPLREHPLHGITGLHAYEKYNDAGTVQTYSYSWKKIIPRQGIQLSHICSWGNDPHPPETTPEELCVNTEPHHHHHDPESRRKRKDSYIMTLDRAFLFISHYIESGDTYYRDVETMLLAKGIGR